MDCDEKYRVLISGFIDGELDDEQMRELNSHLNQCADCRNLLEELREQKKIMEMVFAREHDRALDGFEKGVYARLERKIGWILLSVSAILLGTFGGIVLVRDLILNPEFSLLVRIGVPVGIAGLAVLGVSALRQRITTLRGDPYREVKR